MDNDSAQSVPLPSTTLAPPLPPRQSFAFPPRDQFVTNELTSTLSTAQTSQLPPTPPSTPPEPPFSSQLPPAPVAELSQASDLFPAELSPTLTALPPAHNLVPEDLRPQPEQMLLEWSAPTRPYKQKNRQYYTTVFLIVFLVSLILFVLQQFLFIAVVISIGFVAYVFSAVPPGRVSHQLTTYGIRSDNILYAWEQLGRYWYDAKYNQKMIHFELGRFPNQLTLLLGDMPEEQAEEICSQLLLKEKPVPTSFERAADWLSKKIPLDLEEQTAPRAPER